MGTVKRKLRGTLLCEDRQHSAFIYRFLEKMGYNTHGLYAKRCSTNGSAEQHVRERFPEELRSLRSKGNEQVHLIVMTDGDNRGVGTRLDSLKVACEEAGIEPPGQSERVLICVPTWNIETWIAYLDGNTVDEERGDYPRLDRQRDCQHHVNALVEMCQQGALRDPAPPSLANACDEYRRVFR